MYQYDRKYGTARAVYSWLEFVGWATAILGCLMIIIGFASGGVLGGMYSGRDIPIGFRLIAILPGLGLAIGGVFSVAYVQTARANVDTAEMTREMLEIMRRAEKSIPAASQPVSPEANLSIEGSPEPVALPEGAKKLETVAGRDIIEIEGKYLVSGESFNDLPAARRYAAILSE